MTKPSNVCLTCKWADWDRTAKGNLHPNGRGRCRYKVVLPACKTDSYGAIDIKHDGWLRRDVHPIADCKVWEKAP